MVKATQVELRAQIASAGRPLAPRKCLLALEPAHLLIDAAAKGNANVCNGDRFALFGVRAQRFAR